MAMTQKNYSMPMIDVGIWDKQQMIIHKIVGGENKPILRVYVDNDTVRIEKHMDGEWNVIGGGDGMDTR